MDRSAVGTSRVASSSNFSTVGSNNSDNRTISSKTNKGGRDSDGDTEYDLPVVPSATGRKRAEVYESNHALHWARQVLLHTNDEHVLPMTKEVKAVAKEQLRKLQRPNTRGTKAQAVKTNNKNVQRARNYTKHVSPCGNFDLPDLVVDGKGNPQLREQVMAGLLPPTPFATHGMTGWNESTNASWFREWCAAGCPSRTKTSARKAWHGGSMSSNKEAAVRAFKERTSAQSAVHTGVANTPQKTREERRSFIGLCKILNPEGNASKAVPDWVLNLENELDTADTFWR